MSSRRVYELLDGVQEGVHAFLETCPDTKPTTVDVRIAITENEVTVEELNDSPSVETMKAIAGKMIKNYNKQLANVEGEIVEKKIMNPAHELYMKQIWFKAKLEAIKQVLEELEKE